MIDKVWADVKAAVAGIPDGATILVGGFGEAGHPHNLLQALLEQGTRDLTLVCNNAGYHDFAMGGLIATGAVRKLVCSFPHHKEGWAFREKYLAGQIELELVPQGTLVERLRAAGAGVGGFFTPTGADTDLAAGKEVRVLDGRPHVFERPLKGDVALIRAHSADRWGNLTYHRAQRNFNPVMATAAAVTIAEVDEIVPLGAIDPDAVVTPGVFVQKVVPCPRFQTPAVSRS